MNNTFNLLLLTVYKRTWSIYIRLKISFKYGHYNTHKFAYFAQLFSI